MTALLSTRTARLLDALAVAWIGLPVLTLAGEALGRARTWGRA
ncbi:MAG TPA: hypothetical protein VFT46_07130 [Holophagaceae bacterium]|nr:hypothetical protein [Holophagaceae bacterium]